nr:hypothetical protein Iba_chr12dCG19870 [Ipomoea batatas]
MTPLLPTFVSTVVFLPCLPLGRSACAYPNSKLAQKVKGFREIEIQRKKEGYTVVDEAAGGIEIRLRPPPQNLNRYCLFALSLFLSQFTHPMYYL